MTDKLFPTFSLGAKSKVENEETGILEEEEIKAVVKQALDGLVYLHGRGFLHVSQLYINQ